MILLLKATIGAAVVVLISLLSKSKNYYVAGLLPLFPTFSLIAQYTVGSERSTADLKTTIVFGLWSLIPYAIYMLALYYLVDHLRLVWALSVATLIWVLAAFILVILWNR